LLTLREVVVYLEPSIKKDAIIYHNEDQDSQIKFNFEITLSNSPCTMTSVIYQEEGGINHIDATEHIAATRFDKNSKAIRDPIDNSFQTTMRLISEEEKCNLHGFILLNKTPGTVVISPLMFKQIYMMMRFTNQNLFQTFSLKHKFNHINFGDVQKSWVYSKFGFSFFDFNSFHLPDFSHSDKYNFDYFIKIIPHVFYDESYGTKTLAYQYSINQNERPAVQNQEVPMISIKFDISDVTILVTYQNKRFLHFLTHICAIIGGVFVLFSVLNRVLVTVFDCCFQDSKKKGVASQ